MEGSEVQFEDRVEQDEAGRDGRKHRRAQVLSE